MDGGRWIREKYDYMSLPLWVRPNSIVAMGAVDTRPDYDYASDITFHIFQLDEGNVVEAEVPDIHGQTEMRVRAERKGDIITVTVDNPSKQWSVMLRNITPVEVMDGVLAYQDSLGTCIKAREGSGQIKVRI